MKKETIAMPDGRYLIYFTFGDEPIADESRPADAPPPHSEEKKNV